MDSCVHLAATGFDALPLALVALALLIGGAITVAIVARRRRGWLAALALGALLIGGLGMTAPTPAQAAHCVATAAVEDAAVVIEHALGGSVSGNVLANDEGTDLRVTNPGTYPLQFGTLVIAADGSFTYTLDNSNPLVEALDEGETLTEKFVVRIAGAAGEAHSALTITITGTTDNGAPVALPDTASLAEDATPDAVSGNVLTNDSDPDGDPLTATLVGAPDHGTLTLTSTGAFTYTLDNTDPAVDALDSGEILTDSVDYTIDDGNGGTASSTLTVTISGATDNRSPVAVADSTAIIEDATPVTVAGNVLTNDSDPDGDPLTATVVGTADYGTLTIAADGAFLYTLHNSNPAVNALNTGDSLVDVVSYSIADGRGGTSSSTVTITIVGVTDNRAPVAVNETNTISEDATSPASGNMLANDTDADGDPLTVTIIGDTKYGTFTFDSSTGAYSYTLTPGHPEVEALDDGETLDEVILYRVSDGRGGTDTALLAISITGVTGFGDTNTVREDETPNTVSGNVLANDDGFISVINAGTITLQYGSLEIHADGSYTYTLDNSNPAVDALNTGQHLTDTFTYTASDGNGGTMSATLTIRIDGATDNRPPVVWADTNTLREDATPNTVIGNVLTNDSDPDGNTLSVTNGGTITLQYGSLEIHADGSYTYTLDNSNPAVDALNTGQHLTDTFTYTAADGDGGTASSTLSIRINGSTDNRPPTVEADINTVKEDATPNTVSGNVLTNDSDAGGHTLSVANAGTITLQHGSLEIHSDGAYTYTLDNSNPAVNALNNGQHLTDTFTYTAADGNGGTASTTLTIRVDGSTDNRPPVVTPDTDTVHEDATPNTVSGNVLANDSDPDGHTLSVANAGTITLQYGSLEVQSDGTYTYTLDNSNPAVNALNNGQHLTDTFTYVVADGHGGTNSSTLTVRIDGATDAVGNRPPVVEPDASGIYEDAVPDTVSGWVLDNDSDPDGDTLTVVNAVTIPLQYGSIAMSPDGSWTYSLDNSNPAVDSLPADQTLIELFQYTVSDGQATASGALTITIVGVASAPVAVNDDARVDVGGVVTGNILSNDTDADADSLTVTNAGRHPLPFGTLTIAADGGYTYVPAFNDPILIALRGSASITEEFVYEISDGDGGTSSARLSIAIFGVNNSPVGVDDTLHIERRLPFRDSTGNLLSNDSDPDGDALTADPVWLAYTTYGLIGIEADGSFHYSLDPEKPVIRDWVVGTVLYDQYQYVVRDGAGGVSSAYLYITITG